MSAASQAKRINPSLSVIVVEKGKFISYGSCGLPYYISDEIKESRKLVALTVEKAREERGIEVLTKTEVREISPSEKKAVIRDLNTGEETIVYWDKFILATGASPIVPPVEGVENKRVLKLRNLEDGLNIKNFIDREKPSSCVIIGGGYIGLEMAEALSKRGIRVKIVEALPQLLPNLDQDMSEIVRKNLKDAGVEIFTETKVTGIFEKGEGLVVEAENKGFDCDFVLLAVGVKPNSELLLQAGAKKGPKNSVDVDTFCKTSIENVYAANLITGEKTYIPLGTTANKQGRVAGANAGGGNVQFPGIVQTAVVKVFDLEVARTGLSEREAKEKGFNYTSVKVVSRSRAGYYPGGKKIHLKIIYEKDSGRLLGAQMAGSEGVAKRIDVIASILYFKGTVKDLYNIDFSYAPPFAPVYDPLAVAGRKAWRF